MADFPKRGREPKIVRKTTSSRKHRGGVEFAREVDLREPCFSIKYTNFLSLQNSLLTVLDLYIFL